MPMFKKPLREEEDEMLMPMQPAAPILVCKACSKALQPGERPIDHIRKHPANLYFDTVWSVDWGV